MKESHTLALIVAYYLSKYDKEAYKKIVKGDGVRLDF